MRPSDNIRSAPSETLVGKDLSQLGPSEKTILTEGLVNELIKLCELAETQCAVYEQTNFVAFGRFIKSSEKSEIQITWDGCYPFQARQAVSFTFEMYNEFYVFSSELAAVEPNVLHVKFPKRITRIHQRKSDRFFLEETEYIDATLQEVTGKRHVPVRIVDLSSQGFGLRIGLKDQKEVERILGLDEHMVIYPNKSQRLDETPFSAKIAYWKQENDTIHLGVSCPIPLALGEKDALEDFFLGKKYPNVRRVKTDQDYQDVWRLITEAFQTLTPVDPSKTESSIVTWKKASWSPYPLNRMYVLDSDEAKNQIAATISTSRFYHRTWLIHQLAVDQSLAQVLTHPLYSSVVDYLQQTRDVQYLTGCWPKELRVFKRYYLDFIRNDSDQEAHYLEETNILEFNIERACKDLPASIKCNGIEVDAMERAEEMEILLYLEQKYPALFLDALDFKAL